MAKVIKNIFLEGVSGSIGDHLVLKRTRGGRTILCKKPRFRRDRTFSEAQLARQQVFGEATEYAKQMKDEPLYVAIAKKKDRTGFNVAVADWLNPPQILEIDLGGWDGAAQDLIRMRVRDDVQVVEVSVEIGDGTGAVLEAGPAVNAGASWWEYRVSRALAGALRVTVSASDLPGHVARASEEKLVPC
jgi:hypothetical protein